ncbi:MAG: type II secretion system GspH family protein [Candidatus Nomurabacteria bacterium]|jgi:prepilin-type N-terminal cleavage/methylation domain-containing protein|nr:type II secretion system GspH family protein [Candidatus Nomurabacteria bacterium]
MKQREISTKKGFTIIEVVLVLAIAGLIFLMVFLALPALQRNQRDTQRKDDVSIVGSAVTNYTSNNRGSLPAAGTYTLSSGTWSTVTGGTGFAKYIKEVSSAVSDIAVLSGSAATTAAVSGATEEKVVVATGAQCDTDVSNGKYIKGSSARKSAVFIKLENGDGAFYCQDV